MVFEMHYSQCMVKATIVVFLILFSSAASASELSSVIATLESNWAHAYYQHDEDRQKLEYPLLLAQAAELAARYPNAAEPKIWQATIMVTNAAFQSSLTALSTLDSAKALLEEAIHMNPNALDGAAYVTLGTLYYMVPGWPVSFGDNRKAEQMLKTSLSINPNGVDANYFYADYLLDQDRTAEAVSFLQKAIQAPLRKQPSLADLRLRDAAKSALTQAEQGRQAGGKTKYQSLFADANNQTR